MEKTTQPVPKWLKTLVVGQAVIIVVLLALFIYLTVKGSGTKTNDINSFEDCVAAGGAIMESYPEQCMTKDKRSFTRVLSTE